MVEVIELVVVLVFATCLFGGAAFGANGTLGLALDGESEWAPVYWWMAAGGWAAFGAALFVVWLARDG